MDYICRTSKRSLHHLFIKTHSWIHKKKTLIFLWVVCTWLAFHRFLFWCSFTEFHKRLSLPHLHSLNWAKLTVILPKTGFVSESVSRLWRDRRREWDCRPSEAADEQIHWAAFAISPSQRLRNEFLQNWMRCSSGHDGWMENNTDAKRHERMSE